MKRILLMCMGGFSTGLLVEKMKEAAKEISLEVEIKAISQTALSSMASDYDCLLIAPQINYMADDIEKKYPCLPLYLIEPTDYGRLNGKKILKKAIEIMK